MNKLNVLHVIAGDLNGGAARGAYWLHLALLKENVNSFILTNSKNNLNSKRIEALSNNYISRLKFSILHRTTSLLKYRYLKRNKQIFSTGFDGIDITNHFLYKKADIINLHWINGLLKVKSIKKISKPIVWTIRDMWPMTGGCHHAMLNCKKFTKKCGFCPLLNSKNKHDLSFKILENKIISYAKKKLTIVGLSKWITKQAKSSSVFKNFPIKTIGNCINENNFFPLNKKKIKKKLMLPLDKYIIAVGAQNLSDFYKGFDLFLKSLKKIKTKKFHILLFGRSKSNVIKNYSYTDLGYIDRDSKLREIYSAADVYVSPSRVESYGKTVAEAMYCGTPTVVFNNTGSEDLVKHKINGYIARNFNPNDLARGIDWILNKNNSKKLFKIANKKFNSKKIAKKYKQLYQKILIDNK